MKKQKMHLKPKPPLLFSFTACGIWIYGNTPKLEKQTTSNKKDVTCKRCMNTYEYKKS